VSRVQTTITTTTQEPQEPQEPQQKQKQKQKQHHNSNNNNKMLKTLWRSAFLVDKKEKEVWVFLDQVATKLTA
jgi:hypothetical protein